MSRSIPPWLSGVLEALELERPELVTTEQLQAICNEIGVDVPARIIASRLKEKGWLLETPQRGVWEFAPAEVAGPYSRADPLLALKAFQAAHPGVDVALSLQGAAWAQGLSDRAPSKMSVVFAKPSALKLPDFLEASNFAWRLPLVNARGTKVLSPESIIVHMTNRPKVVRNWNSAMEWLPEVAYDATPENVLIELDGRPSSTWARTGYLLQGMRPDIAEKIKANFSPRGKVRFGSSSSALRNDEAWKVVDYVIPFDPRELESVR